MPVFAIDLDYSVDDTIRKNYNPNIKIAPKQTMVKNVVQTPPIQKQTELIPDRMPALPALPKNIQKATATKQSTRPATTYTKPYQTTTTYKKPIYQKTPNFESSVVAIPSRRNIQTLRKGMIFNVENVTTISDRQKHGTKVIFRTTRPIRMVYYTIPENTEFIGYIVKAHKPQFSANGGLVSVKITYICLGGEYQKVDAKIVKANNKKIFFNNIKGRRLFMKYTRQKGRWGRTDFHEMNRITQSMAGDKTTFILSPFTFAYGVALAGISTATAPALAFFTKGGEVSFPPNSCFYIKFLEDSKLHY